MLVPRDFSSSGYCGLMVLFESLSSPLPCLKSRGGEDRVCCGAIWSFLKDPGAWIAPPHSHCESQHAIGN